MKRNIINSILILALSLFSLSACTPNTYSTDINSDAGNVKEETANEEPINEDATDEEQSNEESANEDATDEEQSNEESANENTSELSNFDTVDNPHLYKDVLNRVHFLITNKDYEVDRQDGETGIFETAMYSEDPLNDIGYHIEDISGDGIPELLIGYIDETTDSASYGSMIFDVYTYYNGGPQLVFEGWGRSAYKYAGGKDFVYHGSGGASYSYLADYTIAEDGKELICNDFYFTKEKDETFSNIAYFHNNSGSEEDPSTEEVAENDFFNAFEQLDNKVKPIKLTPFSSWK